MTGGETIHGAAAVLTPVDPRKKIFFSVKIKKESVYCVFYVRTGRRSSPPLEKKNPPDRRLIFFVLFHIALFFSAMASKRKRQHHSDLKCLSDPIGMKKHPRRTLRVCRGVEGGRVPTPLFCPFLLPPVPPSPE